MSGNLVMIALDAAADDRSTEAAAGRPADISVPWRRWTDFVARFGLAGRTTFWTIVLGAVMAGTISLLMYRSGVQALVAAESQSLSAKVLTAAQRFSTRIEVARRHVRFLAGLQAVSSIVNAANMPSGGASVAVWKDRLADSFSALLGVWPEYHQARLIDLADGREAVRVDRSLGGVVQRVAESDLQFKADRPYFEAIAGLGRDEVYLSAIDLNRENGQIEVSHRPTVRAGTLVFDGAGRPRAMLVLNVDVSLYFNAVRETLGDDKTVYVTNALGDYLTGPDPLRTFGFDFGRSYRLQDDIPAFAAVYDSGRDAISGTVRLGSREFLAEARRVRFDPRDAGHFLVIASLLPRDALLAGIRAQRDSVLIIAVAFILGGAVFAVIMARAVARPIQRMTAAAGRLARGERNVDIGDLLRRRDETGELARSVDAMLRELAEREDRLVAQARELTRSNQELAQFAYVASHDLQEPLRMVGSYLELIDRRYGDRLDAEAKEFIAFAVDGASRMKRLINDLLGYSRAGNNPLKLETVDTRAVVDAVLRTLAMQIEEQNAEIEIGDLPKVKADAIQLERLFMNLIENALKYRSEKPPRIAVTARRGEGGWAFAVSDNGIGIDPRFRHKVFEIFKRLHARDQYSGTGIGLAVSKLVVERHGGHIGVEPNPGGGSVFTFILPD